MGCSCTIFFSIMFNMFFILVPCSRAYYSQTGMNNKVVNHTIPALFVFGDSTVDPGNNNYIPTFFKSNFPPYGTDLPNHIPTGRFTNGKLTTDFIASHLGIKDYVPPYLDRTLGAEELMTGVSFASAGTGYDPLTSQTSNVIPMVKQLQYFKEYKKTLQQMLGKEKMEAHVRKSGFIVSAGTNDFVFTYFGLPVRRRQYDLDEYQNYLIQNTRIFIESLMDLGAQKIGVVGIPPMGCLPVVVTLHSDNPLLHRGCINYYTRVAKEYNQKLELELQNIQRMNSAKYKAQLFYGGIYEALLNIIQNYDNLGFQEYMRGCCGSGMLEAGLLCNMNSPVCADPGRFIFWDSIHPTEKTYYLLFLAFREMVDSLAKI